MKGRSVYVIAQYLLIVKAVGSFAEHALTFHKRVTVCLVIFSHLPEEVFTVDRIRKLELHKIIVTVVFLVLFCVKPR